MGKIKIKFVLFFLLRSQSVQRLQMIYNDTIKSIIDYKDLIKRKIYILCILHSVVLLQFSLDIYCI